MLFDAADLDLPELADPVLVVALSGWVDAGRCGQGAVAYLTSRLEGLVDVAALDLSAEADLLHDRPDIRVIDGTVTSVEWPTLEVAAGTAGRDVVTVTGPEPARGWRRLIDAVVEIARRCGVVEAYCLGGMPAGVTHHDAVGVMSTATDAALGARLGTLRPDYEGPTGLQTCLQLALGGAGIPCGGLWAQVPPYVAATPSPAGVAAVLAHLRDVAGLALDLAPLDPEVVAYKAAVEAKLVERPELAELVEKLQQALGEADEGDDGAGLIREIERFLREGGGSEGDSGGGPDAESGGS